MNDLYVAALEVQTFFEAQQWRFCIIGGLVVARWGQPRATQDVDLTLLSEFGKEERFVDAILAKFVGRGEDAKAFALENRVLLCKASNGIKLDISLAAFDIEREMIERATSFDYAPGVSLLTCSAEDLVLLKAFAGRDLDWGDVRGIVDRQRSLDWEYILPRLERLAQLSEDSDCLERLNKIRQAANLP